MADPAAGRARAVSLPSPRWLPTQDRRIPLVPLAGLTQECRAADPGRMG